MEKINKAFKFKIEPTPAQEVLIKKTLGCVRWTYNHMLSDKIAHYDATGKMLYVTPAQYKEEHPFLKEVDSLALANAQLNLDSAYKNFFDGRAEKPTFKCKSNDESYTTNCNKRADNIRIEGSYIRLPKLGKVKVKFHRQIQGEIKSVTVSKKPSGKYEISILCLMDKPKPLPRTDRTVGFDLGLIDLITTSDGEKFPNPRPYKRYEKKLAKEQRKLSRMREQALAQKRQLSECKNYQKQWIKVAKIHEKIANIRNDFQHKLSWYLVKNHDLIISEDISVRELIQNGYPKSLYDAAWNTFITKVQYKANWYGREYTKVDRYFPSSQICSNCEHNDGKKSLDIREWECSNCYVLLDRDINAACNIHKEGLRIAA